MRRISEDHAASSSGRRSLIVDSAGPRVAPDQPPVHAMRQGRLARNRVQVALVVIVAAVAVVQLPFTIASDAHGARANAHLSASAAAVTRGPAARAGTNIALIRAAEARIPAHDAFAIVRGGRWGTDSHPVRAKAFVWEAGQSWTQYTLAPRIEVPPSRARWLLLRDATPAAVGLHRPLHAWRFGSDWLVERRA